MPLPTGRHHVSDETPGPALATLAICSAGVSALVAGSAIAYQLKHRFLARGSQLNLEWNILLTLALIVCTAQSAVIAEQVEYGLGFPIRMLTSNDVTKFFKLEYVNNLLYIGSLLLLKGVQFLLQIATTAPKPNYWAPAGVMIGMLAFLFAAAFECSSPFWKLRDNQCFNQTAFWYAFGAFDIITDIYSVSTVVWAGSGLHISRQQKKAQLLIVLASRYLPTACAVARLCFIRTAYGGSNYTIALYKLAIPTQLQLHLSIVALSLGKVFAFLSFLNVGYLSSAIEPTHPKGNMSRAGASKYGYNSKIGNHSASHRHTKQKPSISDHDSSKGLVPDVYGQSITDVEGGVPMGRMHGVPMRQPEGQFNWTSRGESGPGNEIMVTKEVEIRSENAHAKHRAIDDDVKAY